MDGSLLSSPGVTVCLGVGLWSHLPFPNAAEISNLPKKTDFMETSWLTAQPRMFHLILCYYIFKLFRGYFSAIKLIPELKHNSLVMRCGEGVSKAFTNFLLCPKQIFGSCVWRTLLAQRSKDQTPAGSMEPQEVISTYKTLCAL